MEEVKPYDWSVLKERCVLAIDQESHDVLGELDADCLQESDAAFALVNELFAVLSNSRVGAPELSAFQIRDRLERCRILLDQSDSPEQVVDALPEMEAKVLKQQRTTP